ncbi:unnamed protein product [Anisakis simplex]|uniref:Uncharacterized protein n=1 Tax=Anisakis simplex TaxID=6269 RepID=A0A0M3JXL2_ANISI|nr:unnamed protein product [Anisakis simplex]
MANSLPVGSISYSPSTPEIDQLPLQLIQNTSSARSAHSRSTQYTGDRKRTYSDDLSSVCLLNPNEAQPASSRSATSPEPAKLSAQCCCESSKVLYSAKRLHHNYNNNKVSRRERECVKEQSLGQALIARLQEWCRQLLWLTLMCVIGCCGGEKCFSEMSCCCFRTIRFVRNSCTLLAAPCGGGARMKTLANIEMKLLRHLTMSSGRVGALSKRCGGFTPRKRRVASRAPSPQLYDINEEELEPPQDE